MATKKAPEKASAKTPAEKKPRQKTPGMGRRNVGYLTNVEKNCTASRSEISEIVQEVVKWRKQPKVRTDEELADRLELFFRTCVETGEIPSMEKLFLALGSYKQQVWDWEHGVQRLGSHTADLIKQAKGTLAAIEAALAQHRKIPETTYIFRSKNYYGMRDQQEVMVIPQNPLGQEADPEALAAKYAQALPGADQAVLQEGVDYPSTMPAIESKKETAK